MGLPTVNNILHNWFKEWNIGIKSGASKSKSKLFQHDIMAGTGALVVKNNDLAF